jgi:hypothetical protein
MYGHKLYEMAVKYTNITLQNIPKGGFLVSKINYKTTNLQNLHFTSLHKIGRVEIS